METEKKATRQPRAIVSVLGSDRPGIVAAVSGMLAAHEVNILDISQTILQGTFTMTMLVDLAPADCDFAALSDELGSLADQLGVQINFQREELFRYMYRI